LQIVKTPRYPVKTFSKKAKIPAWWSLRQCAEAWVNVHPKV